MLVAERGHFKCRLFADDSRRAMTPHPLPPLPFWERGQGVRAASHHRAEYEKTYT